MKTTLQQRITPATRTHSSSTAAASLRSSTQQWRQYASWSEPTLVLGSLTAFIYWFTKEDNHLGSGGRLQASLEGCHPPHQPWYHHSSHLHGYDHQSIRRGYQVYKEVCAACHGLKRIAFRHMVGAVHTEAEAKAEAAEREYEDGPNDDGEMFQRPGKLTDYLVGPYPNDQAGRLANNGALPPDLSNIVKGREGYEDYIFALLTGYSEPPAGIVIKGALHFNKYFPGGAIAMARNLYDELVEYEDGTPATTSQMAKDVTTFLAWSSYPEHDERKLSGFKYMVIAALMFGTTMYMKRHSWSYLKTQKFAYKPPSPITRRR